MKHGKPFWSLNRRDLFKLLPPSVASWALASPLLSKPARSPEAVLASPAPEVKKWQAEWIWERISGPFFQPGFLKNIFTYFRKTFDYQGGVKKAVAQISADSRYKLYVNGHYLGRGPARFDPTWPYYDEFDIASVLRPGKNVIAVLVHYYGEKTGWYLGGVRPGLLFECSIGESGGGPTLVKTDATWKYLRAPMWAQNAPRVSGALGFTEIYDAGKEVEGWNLPAFDDSRWQQPHIIRRISGDQPPMGDPFPWDNLVPRDIPMLMEKEVAPSQVTFVGEVQNLAPGATPTLAHQMSQETPGPLKNCTVENAESLTAEAGGEAVIRTTPLTGSDSSSAVIVLDFGRELTGRQLLELEGVAGGIVDMGVCESLANGRVTPTRNGLHFNRLVMRDGPQRWEAFEWDGFRYLQLTVRNCPRPVKLRKVAVNFTSYPVGNRGAFESSDSMLNKIWKTSSYTVQLCMHDGFEDCPNREQRQWVGDAYVETKVTYVAFGDTKLTAKYLRQIAQSQRPDGIIQMFWPGDDQGGVLQLFNIKDFVLHWISTVWEYYRFTGDEEMVRELFPNLVKALGWFEKRVDAQGLLANITPWVFGDWAPLDRRDRNTILNALFYNVLRETTQMATLVGDEATRRRYDELAGRVKAGINECLWDARRGVYVDSDADGVPSGRISQQANTMCLLYDIAAPEKRSGILSYIFDPQRIKIPEMFRPAQEGFDNQRHVVQAQPFFMHWVNAALAHVGEYERMVQLIRDLFGKMIEAGATSIWETWRRTDSECHGWSGTVAYDLPTYILGVRGITPGFGRFVIEPHPAQLEWARGVFPSVKGDIPVSWRSGAGEFHIEGNLPAATAASVLIPRRGGKNPSRIQLNGKPVWEGSRPVAGASAKGEANGVRIQLEREVRYTIVARY